LGYPLPLGVKIPIEEIEKPEETESQLLIEDNKELEIPAFLRKKKRKMKMT